MISCAGARAHLPRAGPWTHKPHRISRRQTVPSVSSAQQEIRRASRCFRLTRGPVAASFRTVVLRDAGSPPWRASGGRRDGPEGACDGLADAGVHAARRELRGPGAVLQGHHDVNLGRTRGRHQAVHRHHVRWPRTGRQRYQRRRGGRSAGLSQHHCDRPLGRPGAGDVRELHHQCEGRAARQAGGNANRVHNLRRDARPRDLRAARAADRWRLRGARHRDRRRPALPLQVLPRRCCCWC